jgi:hypothetical protein
MDAVCVVGDRLPFDVWPRMLRPFPGTAKAYCSEIEPETVYSVQLGSSPADFAVVASGLPRGVW